MKNKQTITIPKQWLEGLIRKTDHIGKAFDDNDQTQLTIEVNMIIAYIQSAKYLIQADKRKKDDKLDREELEESNLCPDCKNKMDVCVPCIKKGIRGDAKRWVKAHKKAEAEDQEETDALCQICGTNKASWALGDICGECK